MVEQFVVKGLFESGWFVITVAQSHHPHHGDTLIDKFPIVMDHMIHNLDRMLRICFLT